MKNFRIIPRLEVKTKNLIKGMQMEGLRKIGCPINFSKKYLSEMADEIFYDDIVASLYNRPYDLEIINKISENLNIPLVVGGGIKSLSAAREVFKNGADRVSVNSAALTKPSLIQQIAQVYGSQSISAQLQIKRLDNRYEVFGESGRIRNNIELFDWINTVQNLGVGEIICIFIDRDGMRGIADIEILKKIRKQVRVQLIYGGGTSKYEEIKLINNLGFNGICMSRSLHFNELKLINIKKDN